MGDFLGNIHPIKKGLLATEKPVIYAGIHYIEPWVRDAAFNIWNGASLIVPEASENTLLSIMDPAPLSRCSGCGSNHYWDAIISVTGFWAHYLYTGNRDFLALCFDISRNTMRFFEDTEYDLADGLFRGLACCMDGISGYPDELAYPVNERSDYGGARGCKRLFTPEQLAPKGYGIPFKTLSTNCLYFQAYRILSAMAGELGTAGENWPDKAEQLKIAINREFWCEARQHYSYITGCPIPPGRCDHQEGLGHSFAVMFGIADSNRVQLVQNSLHHAPAGSPYLWPTFPRYKDKKYGDNEYGRASGTVWPHTQPFWAEAALRNGRPDIFRRELMLMAEHAERDGHFAEVLHPETGEIYGGVQEVHYTSKPRQTWCATGFIRMALRGLSGMEFMPDGIIFSPYLPADIDRLVLSNLHYRGAILRVEITGHGPRIKKFMINGKAFPAPRLAANCVGAVDIKIQT